MSAQSPLGTSCPPYMWQWLMLAQRISIAPGHLFSADRRFRHCLRLNYGYPGDARLEDALKTVGQLAHGLCGGPPGAA